MTFREKGEANNTLSEIAHKIFRVLQDVLQEGPSLFNQEGVTVLDDTIADIAGETFPVVAETRAIAHEDQSIGIPNQLASHLKTRTLRVDRALLVEFLQGVDGVEDDHGPAK